MNRRNIMQTQFKHVGTYSICALFFLFYRSFETGGRVKLNNNKKRNSYNIIVYKLHTDTPAAAAVDCLEFPDKSE